MTLADLGNLGELIGAIGVVASLVYLAIQIRQNTTSLKATATRSAIDSISRIEELIISDRAVADLLATGLLEPDKLDPLDEGRFDVFASSLFSRYESAFLQAEASLLSEDVWRSHEARMLEVLASPGGRAWWNRRRSTLAPQFRAYVDERLDGAASAGNA